MSTAVVFQQMLIIFVLIGIGFLIFKKGWCPQESRKHFSFLVTSVCNPAIMISSAMDRNTAATRQDIVIAAGIACVIFLLLILGGYLLPIGIKVPKEERKYYNMMTVYGNLGFIGIPVVSAVLGTSAVIYVTVFNLFFHILIYTHGIMVLSPEKRQNKKQFWKQFINVGTIAAVLTIIIFWFQIPLPTVIEQSVTYAGRCTTFLSMVVLGASLSEIRFREIFSVPRLYVFTLIRMVIFPILTGIVLKQLFANQLMNQAIVLMMAMPVANMPLMMANQYEMKCEVLSKGILLTTMLSLVTITLVSIIGAI